MVNYTVLPNSMIVSVNGKRFTLSKEDSRYGKVIELIKAKNGEPISDTEMTELCDPTISFKEEGVELIDGKVHIQGEEMPSELSERILAMKKEGIPVIQLMKFWENLKENPSMNSVMQLYKFLEVNSHPLTEDGHFIAYRSVRNDFKDYHTGTMDNSPGQTVSMPRNKVNDKPEETCSNGLHVASWAYASTFGQPDRKMIEVKVNPKDVVCVPNDYNNTKMRVCKFEVLTEVEGPKITAFISDDLDEEDNYSCGECGEETCECDENEYSDDDRETVINARDQFLGDYEGNGLIARIEEETGLDRDLIEEILDKE